MVADATGCRRSHRANYPFQHRFCSIVVSSSWRVWQLPPRSMCRASLSRSLKSPTPSRRRLASFWSRWSTRPRCRSGRSPTTWPRGRRSGQSQWNATSRTCKQRSNGTSRRSSSAKLGNVPVADVRPRGWQDNGQVLVHAHGGGYALGTLARACTPAPAAHATGLRVISVDYTVTPLGSATGHRRNAGGNRRPAP